MNYEMLGWENTNLTYRFVLWNLIEKVLVIRYYKQVARENATIKKKTLQLFTEEL